MWTALRSWIAARPLALGHFDPVVRPEGIDFHPEDPRQGHGHAPFGFAADFDRTRGFELAQGPREIGLGPVGPGRLDASRLRGARRSRIGSPGTNSALVRSTCHIR